MRGSIEVRCIFWTTKAERISKRRHFAGYNGEAGHEVYKRDIGAFGRREAGLRKSRYQNELPGTIDRFSECSLPNFIGGQKFEFRSTPEVISDLERVRKRPCQSEVHFSESDGRIGRQKTPITVIVCFFARILCRWLQAATPLRSVFL